MCRRTYRPITRLNTELKMLVRVLANRLHLVTSDLIGTEQNYAVKGRSIQDNLRLVRTALEGLQDDTKATLINLDLYKAFDMMDYQFLVTVLETVELKPEFSKWISILDHNSQAVVQVNGVVRRRSRSSGRSGRVAPCLFSSMSLSWSPCSEGLGMGRQIRLERNWLEVWVKVEVQVRTWLRRRLI